MPASVSAPAGQPLDLRVLLVLDGIGATHVEALLTEAAAVYAPLGLRLVSCGTVALPLAGDDAGNLREQARTKLGGGRPPGVDLAAPPESRPRTSVRCRGARRSVAAARRRLAAARRPALRRRRAANLRSARRRVQRACAPGQRDA